MPIRKNGRQKSRPFPPPADRSSYGGTMHRTILPVFLLGMPAPQPLPRRRPNRGQLPDVDFSRAAAIGRPSALARLFGLLRRIVRQHKPASLVNPDTTI